MNAHTVPPNLSLIGGEMLGVADFDAGRAGGAALAYLAGTSVRANTRVLVAGPHDDALLDALLARGARVTCLLRAYADAQAVATGTPAIRVLAGSLSKLDTAEAYDAVIALDGCDRLCSVEGPQLTWQECVAVLGAVLAPDGIMLLAVANPLGVDRLVEMPSAAATVATGSTVPTIVADDTAPAGVAAISDRLGSGTTLATLYAGYPTAGAPTLLMPTPVPPDDERAALAAAACAYGFAGRPVLADPRALAATAVRAGAGADLAPVWIAVVTATGAPVPSLPGTIVADLPGDQAFSVAYELTADGIREPVPAPAHHSGPLTRDGARLAGPVPRGRHLGELLLRTAARPDPPALRTQLRAYATWLASVADPVVAVPANVVVDGSAYALLDPSWTWSGGIPHEVALARALRQLAVDLVAGGFHHPWPSTVGVDELTVLLAAAAGHPVGPATIPAAIDLEADVRSTMDGLDRDGRDGLRAALAEERPVSSRVDLDGHRELRAALLRERAEVARLQAQIAWYAKNLTDRENEVARNERTIALFSGSIGYRSGKLVMATARSAKSGLRPVKRQVKKLLGH